MTGTPAPGTQRERIAILGGGIGSLSAAWHLTSTPGWQGRYAITVYQQGWRLGVNDASGGDALHTLFGFYANTFALMRAVYERLGRTPGTPLATWRDAFKPHDRVALAEPAGRPWHIAFPALPGEPGTGEPVTMWQMAMTLLGWIGRWLDELARLQHIDVQGTGAARSYRLLSALARTMPEDSLKHQQHQHTLLAQALDGMRARVRATWEVNPHDGEDLQRLHVCLETASTVLKGLFADGVFIEGFDVVNGIDLRAWLAKHGGHPELCIGSTLVRAACDMMSADEDGDSTIRSAEAGSMLRGMLRLMFGYKGSVIFTMQAGMGDTVFAPLYQVLAGRGVKFRFFHRVEELVPDGGEVAAIRITRQATLLHGRFLPLVKASGLDCWPTAPDCTQVAPAQSVLLLKRGRDFDKVVFGMPVTSLAALCPRLLAASAPLRAASEHLRTVDWSTRCVWSAACTAQYRPASDGTGFSNLFIAADWLKTGLDASCIEAAVMGGMQASRAICGFPERIEGEFDA